MNGKGSFIIDTPQGIDFFQVAQHKYGLDIQIHTGLKHSRGSVWKDAQRRYGLTGNMKTVRDKLSIIMEYMQQNKGKPEGDSSFVAPLVEANWNEMKKYVNETD